MSFAAGPPVSLVVTCSPVPSHPSTALLEKTLISVWRYVDANVAQVILPTMLLARMHLPKSSRPIRITFEHCPRSCHRPRFWWQSAGATPQDYCAWWATNWRQMCSSLSSKTCRLSGLSTWGCSANFCKRIVKFDIFALICEQMKREAGTQSGTIWSVLGGAAKFFLRGVLQYFGWTSLLHANPRLVREQLDHHSRLSEDCDSPRRGKLSRECRDLPQRSFVKKSSQRAWYLCLRWAA